MSAESLSNSEYVEPQLRTEAKKKRESARCKLINRIDPVYLLLDRIVFDPFFNPRLPGAGAPITSIEIPEINFLLENIRKHRAIIWANAVAVAAMLGSGLTSISESSLVALRPGLSAPVIVSGIAWYSISFSGVPERFGRHAMLVTGVLFLAVSFSLTTLFVVIATVTPIAVALAVVLPIYVALYLAAVFYDNLDGLRATAAQDTVVFSRAQTYLRTDEGPHMTALNDVVSQETQSLQAVDSQAAETFAELAMSLDKRLDQLAAGQPPTKANILIADCLNEVARLLTLTPYPLELDEDFLGLVTLAHDLSVHDVNERAARHLRVVIERIHALLGDLVAEESAAIRERLRHIERLRSRHSRMEDQNQSGTSVQDLADILFVEVFRQILSLMRANKTRVLTARIPQSAPTEIEPVNAGIEFDNLRTDKETK